jgi:ribosome-associated heat shock protein Hsp15
VTGLDAPRAAEAVRLDKWLWAARIFKTRSLAQEACRGGHVRVNDHTGSPARALRVGDRIEVRKEERRLVLEVAAVESRRGPAPAARRLYVDHSPPPPPREAEPFVFRDRGAGRPTKRDRRAIRRARGR